MYHPAGRWLGLALVAAVVLTSCSGPQDPTVPPIGNGSPTSPTGTTASPRQTDTKSTKRSTRNDLTTGRATRTVNTGDISVGIEYVLRNKVQDWAPGESQPLTVTMTAISSDDSEKIYLSGVTVYLDVADSRGHVNSPDPLVDRANITPGYLVTSPAMYIQVFALPPLPADAKRLTIDIRYEMLRLQRGADRDFAKLSTTNTIVITRP